MNLGTETAAHTQGGVPLSLLGRISRLMKPGGKHPAAAPPPSSYFYEEDRAFEDKIWPLLRVVIATREEESPDVKRAGLELREIARKEGYLATAAQVRLQLRSLHGPEAKQDGYVINRGYMIAADLVFHHILEEIDAIRNEDKKVGPNGFRLTCNDLVDCLMMTKHIRRSVEIPILAVDKLLVQAVDDHDSRELYLKLALQALESTSELIFQRYEQEQGQIDEERQLEEERAAAGEEYTQRFIETHIDAPLVLYLRQFKDDLFSLHTELSVCDASSPMTELEVREKADPETTQAHYAFLQTMLGISNRTAYNGFSAWMMERAGTFLLKMDPQKSQQFYRAAAESYARQGEHEAKVSLNKLATIRFEKATKLFEEVGDADKAKLAAVELARVRQHA